jgi:hypothetical protein
MKKLLPIFTVITLFSFVISACGSVTQTAPTQAVSQDQPRLDRDAGGSYSAVFQVQFVGAKSWEYQLNTRKSPAQREINLHIGGLDSTQNPGDIRMLTDNTTTWMKGAGTDNQCVQFPNGQGMDPTYIYPESLVSEPTLAGSFKLEGEETLADIPVLHFRAANTTSGAWKDAAIDIWQEKATGKLRQFSMTAGGNDPFFSAGAGKLTARYITSPLGSDAIAPIDGCQISVPLPQGISMYVRLPGMASFDSQSSVADLVKFFQSALPAQKWVEKDPLAQAGSSAVLSYQREKEEVEIHIETKTAGGGSSVKLLIDQTQ